MFFSSSIKRVLKSRVSVYFQVMLAKLTNDPTYINAIKSFCDSKVNQPKTPKGLLFISQWGALRHASNIAYICLQVKLIMSSYIQQVFFVILVSFFFQAADLGINSLAYRKLAQQQIHYALGDTGRSFVCGFGTNPPVRSHHRSRYVMSRNNSAIFI